MAGPSPKPGIWATFRTPRPTRTAVPLIDVTVKGPTLVDKDGAPTAILGKALVVHAMRDDYKTQPSGDSGARVACGVIR